MLTAASKVLTFYPNAPYTVTRTSGTLPSGQAYVMYAPNSGPTYPPIVFTHQRDGIATFIDTIFVDATLAQFLAGQGFVCISGLMHGNSWGNTQSITDIDEELAHVDANTNADISTVGFVGFSMGWVSCCAWTAANPGKTFAMSSMVGACSLVYCHDNGFDPDIDTAYGNHAGYLAAVSTHDPLTLAQAGTFDAIPIAVWWGTSDTTVGPAASSAFIAAADRAVSMTPDAQVHFGIGLISVPAVGSFIMDQYTTVTRTRTIVL